MDIPEPNFIPQPNFASTAVPQQTTPLSPPPMQNFPSSTARSPTHPTLPMQHILQNKPTHTSAQHGMPRAVAAPPVAPNQLANSDDDNMFLELDLPTVSKFAPRGGNDGGDDDGDLLNQLPTVPGGKPPNSSSSGHNLSSSEAVLSRPRPSAPSSSASALDDDDLMRRFQALKDNK